MFLLLDNVMCGKRAVKRQRAQFKSNSDSYRSRHKPSKSNGEEQEEFTERRARSNIDNKNKQCAVMYKNEEPIGLLEPFEDSYRLLPISGEKIPVDITPLQDKRRNLMDLLYPSKFNADVQDLAPIKHKRASYSAFSDEKYPYIFAKFKIENKIDRESRKRAMHKRDSSRISDQNVSALKATLAKMNGENNESVNEELRNILDTMGLIEDDKTMKEEQKRSAEEDENMELGSNKINMVKDHLTSEKRQKRSETSTTTASNKKSKREAEEVAGTAGMVEDSATLQSLDLLERGDTNENKESDCDKTEKEEKSRGKRETANEIKEASSPQNNVNDESDLTDYEKRVVRDIREKIAKLKEEVKKEIEEIKTGSDSQYDEINTQEPQRKKREVKNNLLDQESVAINPLFNAEEEPKPHIRRRRSLEDENDTNATNYYNTFNSGRKLMQANEISGKFHHKNLRKRHVTGFFDRSKRKADNKKGKSKNIKARSKALSTKIPKKNRKHNSSKKSKRKAKEQVIEYDANVTNSVFKREIPKNTQKRHKRDLEDVYNTQLDMKDKIAKAQHACTCQNDNHQCQCHLGSNVDTNNNIIEPHTCGCQKEGHECKCHLGSNKNIGNLEFYMNLLQMNAVRKMNNAVGISAPKRAKRSLLEVENEEDSNFLQESDTENNNFGIDDDKQHTCDCENNGHDCKCHLPKSEDHFETTIEVNNPTLVEDETTLIMEGTPATINEEWVTEISNENVKTEHETRIKRDTQQQYDDSNNVDTDQEISDQRLPRSSEDHEDQEDSAIEDNQKENESKKHPCNCQKNNPNCKCGTSEEDSIEDSVAFDDYDDYDKISKRDTEESHFENGEYYLDLHPDVFQISPSRKASREKRQSFKNLIDRTSDQLIAVRERSEIDEEPHSRFRRRTEVRGELEQPQQLTDMSDEDIFGALPQGFEGELARYKRVKREEER